MPDGRPRVSVIIPTRDRVGILRHHLEALGRQRYPVDRMEVVVVADGSTDETIAELRTLSAPFTKRVVPQTHQGPAAARNTGAAHATGSLLIFVDDDIEATPTLVEGHVRASERHPGSVVIGYLPAALRHQTGFFKIILRHWWEEKFDALRQPGHRFHGFDLLSGNFSLTGENFRRLGGFDPALRCHEDYELGVRLMKAGVPFAFASEAAGYHHEATDLRQALQRKYDEGLADVTMGRKHPDMRQALPLARLSRMRSRRVHAMRSLGFATPAVARSLTAAWTAALAVVERLRMRTRWRRLLNDLLSYWYWRGVADALGSPDALAEFIREATPAEWLAPEIDLDLRAGVDTVEQAIDDVRPAGVRIRFGDRAVGRILPEPGAERLRAAHLRPLLATHLASPLLRAMAETGAIGAPYDVHRLLASCAAYPTPRVHGIESA